LQDPELEKIVAEKVKKMSQESSKVDGHPVKLTAANFQDYSNGEKPLLVDFWAEWCGPCKFMEPAVDRLASKYSDYVVFGKVNVDEEMNLSSKYEVFSIPTFILFKAGQPIDAVVGAVGEKGLEEFILRKLNIPRASQQTS
jgi:thioredoxin 1